MSAIGSYVRIGTQDLDRCLALASRVTRQPPSKWPWQAKAETGLDAFARAWAAAVLEEVVFDGSGHLLSSYVLAQNELNNLEDPFDSPEGITLANVFTAAFPVRIAQPFPALDERALEEFCRSEWGDEGPDMYSGLARAHAFFDAGVSRVASGEAVVFIIA
jgi:hypothetical protein